MLARGTCGAVNRRLLAVSWLVGPGQCSPGAGRSAAAGCRVAECLLGKGGPSQRCNSIRDGPAQAACLPGRALCRVSGYLPAYRCPRLRWPLLPLLPLQA